MSRWLLWAGTSLGILVGRWLPIPIVMTLSEAVLVIMMIGVVLTLHWALNRNWKRRPMMDCGCSVCERLRQEGWR